MFQKKKSQFQLPPSSREIRGPKLLLVGGKPSFVPSWISENLTFKHFQYSKENVLGNFEPDAIILFVKATDDLTRRQTFHYGYSHEVPVLVLRKGWSHLIEDAKEQGLDWLAVHYPYEIFIPTKDRKKSAKRRKTKPTQLEFDWD
jgi:hypothetical protein